MYVFVLLLLVLTIAAVPNSTVQEREGLLTSNAVFVEDPDLIPFPIANDAVQLFSQQYYEVAPCIANDTAHHANVTEELRWQIRAHCFAQAGYADTALYANGEVFRVARGIKELNDECVKAFFGLGWKQDARLNASLPLTKQDRKSVCSFLGDLSQQFCKLREACAASQERLTIEFAQYYGGLHLVATNGTKTDEDCPTASIPFFKKINPHAFTADFDAHHESLLDPSVCS